MDADGEPVAAAVVSNGDNWTPSNADGSFWLDNVVLRPTIDLQVAHHLFICEYVQDVALDTEDLEVVMTTRLQRVELVVTSAETRQPLPLITIDWRWANGGAPHQFVPTPRNWHAADGRYDVVVPEGATGAFVGAAGCAPTPLETVDLEDGRVTEVALPPAE